MHRRRNPPLPAHPAWHKKEINVRGGWCFCRHVFGVETHDGTQNKWKNHQRSRLTHLGISPLQGVCQAPHPHRLQSLGVDVGPNRQSLSVFYGRLYADRCLWRNSQDIRPQRAFTLNCIVISFVYWCVHCFLSLGRNRKTIDFGPEGVCGGPLFAPPFASARVQSRFDFVELGGDMCSNDHRRR